MSVTDVTPPAVEVHGRSGAKMIDGLLGGNEADYVLNAGPLSTIYWTIVYNDIPRTVSEVALYMPPTFLDHPPLDGETSYNPKLPVDFLITLRGVDDSILTEIAVVGNSKCVHREPFEAIGGVKSVSFHLRRNNGALNNAILMAEIVVS